ncbi:NADH:flavin oxidoreductase/NADH oxidase family protein [Streptomyces goshikiensis]|uniref:NADH:flavin oxidoreductase/NADH oxidase family protein n=1 Tax=Streptomyces goshikiensis TaxID=1942 RepID=UPI0036CE6CF1
MTADLPLTDLLRSRPETPTDLLYAPLRLACGAVLPNRIGKAALEESLAVTGQLPDYRIFDLYRRWAAGGVGLQITGNVMVHAGALTSPGTIVLDAHAPLDPFIAWAQAARSGDGEVWMQINHPGRQVTKDLHAVAWAPSAVAVDIGRYSKLFSTPTAMTRADIQDTVERFATTAARAEEAGFTGVQVHAAHGYLISQFLSPLTNQRTDEWGGPLENRARLLLEVIDAVRSRVSAGFAMGVKLNSSDFQRGGFDLDDARRVLHMLGDRGVDLVELSGGSVESPAMQGRTTDERTLAREAFFLAFVEEMMTNAPVPIMLTGGITRRSVAEKVLQSGASVVGMGTALALRPDLPQVWRTTPSFSASLQPVAWKDKVRASAAILTLVRRELRRTANGQSSRPSLSPGLSLMRDEFRRGSSLRRYRAWILHHPDGLPRR